jgi:diguanylate cyclase (GGDEF)-like protein
MQTRLGSFVGVPMMEGPRCIGVLSAVHPDVGFFGDEQCQQLTLMAGLCAPHIEAARLKRLARIDPLTGALNRRGFDSQFPQIFADAGGLADPLSVVMVDIDRFKEINDVHGHAAGDDVLRSVTGLLASVLRETDAVVRYGGEEFMMVLPHATIRGAESVAERARAAIERAQIALPVGTARVTASFGVAQRRAGESREDLLRRADEAMYRAKAVGRNRVVVAA